MTADDDDVDDASLKSMRAVWLSMRDEEPPSAGMSALLAAAAQKAEQMRAPAKLAWWERAYAMLRRPPVLAFASVMLLIGGAVLVTRSNQEPVESMTAGTPAGQAQLSAPALDAATATQTSDDDGFDQGAQVPVEEPAAKPADTPAVDKPTPTVKRKRATKPERAQTYKEEARALDEKPQVGTKGMAGLGDTAGSTLESPPPPPPPAPMATPRAPEPKTTPKPAAKKDSAPPTRAPVVAPAEPAPAAEDSVKLSDRASPKPTVEDLARQAESAAARGDCAAVRTLVSRIRQQDESFYKQRIAKHAAIAKCL